MSPLVRRLSKAHKFTFEGHGEEALPGVLPLSRGAAASTVDGRGDSRGLSLYYPLIVIGLVLYGSLIPLDLDPSVFTSANGFGLGQLGWPRPSIEDLLTNLLVYLPVGMTLMAAVGGGPVRRLAFVPLVVLIGAVVSLSAEVLQVGLSQRHASWIDVMLNTMGTAIGAAATVGFAPLARRFRRRWQSGFNVIPWTTAASALTLGLLLYNLAPFDFVTNTTQLHDSFRNARWSLSTPRQAIQGAGPLSMPAATLAGAAWFAALGFVGALGRRENRCRTVASSAWAAVYGVLFAAGIEFLQLFTRSHVFDVATLSLRAVAVTLGAWSTIYLRNLSAGLVWRSGRNAMPPLLILAGLVVFQIFLALAGVLDLGTLFATPLDPTAVQWVPFESLWRRPMLQAFSAVLLALIQYGTFAATVALFARFMRAAHPWAVAAGLTVMLAVCSEGLQAVSSTGTPDLTEPVLALAGAWLTHRVVHALRVTPAIASPPMVTAEPARTR